MAYYDTYMSLVQQPKTAWIDDMQELVNEMFDDSSTVEYDIEEEQTFGEFDFAPVEVRLTTIVDVKTGQRNGDDYRKLIFKDRNHKPVLGTRYRFDDNIWIVFAVKGLRTATSSCYIRRCNQTLNFQDKYGNIHYEPCYIDYKLNETQMDVEDQITIPKGRLNVVVQLNKWTYDIDIEKRYVIGEDIYKTRYRAKYDRAKTYERYSVGALQLYIEYDVKGPNDNFDLMVADYKEYNFSISCDTTIAGFADDTGTLTPTILLNKEPFTDTLIYSTNNAQVVTIDEDGNYTLLQEGEADITVSMKNNTNVFTTVHVTVGSEDTDAYVTPDVPTIKLNKTVTYEIKCNQTLDISLETNASIDCYKFTVLGDNKFSVRNMKQTRYLLKVNYSSEDGTITGTYVIRLGGMV